MAPPLKRRRLLLGPPAGLVQEQELDDTIQQHRHAFSHTVSQTDPASAQSPSVEELHVEIHEKRRGSVTARQAVTAGDVLRAALSSDSTISSTSASDLPESSSSATASTLLSSQPIAGTPQSASISTDLVPSTTSSSVPSSSDSTTSLFTPIITSIPRPSSTSSTRNLTYAANISTSGLNGTYSFTGVRTSSLLSPIYSNSSYTSTRSSSTTPQVSSSSTDGDNVMTSVVLTTATLSNNGQAASTITTQVGAIGYSAPPSPTATDTNASTNNASAPPPPPGTIAGGVVGGAAGLAVLLLVAMLFLRWYRRRSQGAQQALLPASGDYHDSEPGTSRDGPGMAERAGLRPWAAAIPALMRHQPPSHNDSSNPPAARERGFERISGRKLPSAWSPGMEGAPPPIPAAYTSRGSAVSSFYPDSITNVNPFTDHAEGSSPDEGSSLGRQNSDERTNERMTVVPGPQRRPTIHDPNRQVVVSGDTNSKHMSSMARTSGMATTVFQPEGTSAEHPSHFKEQV